MSEAGVKMPQYHKPPSHFPHIPLEVAAWMAGFFEGEGTVLIRVRRPKKYNEYRCGFLRVYNTEKEALGIFKKYVGGCICLTRRAGSYVRGGIRSRVNYYTWETNGFKAYFLCKAILPHMRTSKRIKAEELIYFYEERYPALKGAN